jgi:hypothetical protein
MGTAKYILTLHDRFEAKTHNMAQRNINVRPAPNGIWVTATTHGQDLNVYMETAESWEVNVSFSGEPAKFLAGNFGVEVGFSRTVTKSVGASATCPNVPLGYSIRPEIYDAVKVHTGLADEWDEAGYVGEVSYEITEPDEPAGGLQASVPILRGGGDPPPPGGGN